MNIYKVVETKTLTELIRIVNEHLSRGWKCQGGVSSLKYLEGYHLYVEYSQAMVKELE